MGLRVGSNGSNINAPSPPSTPPPVPALLPTETEGAADDLFDILADAVRELDAAGQMELVNAFQSGDDLSSAPPSVRALFHKVVTEFLE